MLKFLYLLKYCSGLHRWFLSFKSFLTRLMVQKGLKRLKRFLNIGRKDKKFYEDLSSVNLATTLTEENRHKSNTLFYGISTT